MRGYSYTRYHAISWAAGHSTAEIEAEIQRVEHKARTHEFQWNEVGNRTDTWARADFLRGLLADQKEQAS